MPDTRITRRLISKLYVDRNGEPPLNTNEQRIEDLETQLAFQETTLQELNDAVIAQQSRIDALEGAIEQLARAQADAAAARQADEKPPHYPPDTSC